MPSRTKSTIGALVGLSICVASWLLYSSGRSEAGWTPAGCPPTFGSSPIPTQFQFYDEPYHRAPAVIPQPEFRRPTRQAQPLPQRVPQHQQEARIPRPVAPPKPLNIIIPGPDELGIQLESIDGPVVVPSPDDLGIILE